jgi:hypothetical protein
LISIIEQRSPQKIQRRCGEYAFVHQAPSEMEDMPVADRASR